MDRPLKKNNLFWSATVSNSYSARNEGPTTNTTDEPGRGIGNCPVEFFLIRLHSTDMPDFDEDAVRNRLKEAVQGFIQRVRSEHENIPKTTVMRADESGTSRREVVPKPSRVFTEYRIGADKDTPILHDAGEWLYESGNGFELSLSDDEGNEIEDPDKDQVVPWYANEILMLAGQVMDYNGGFTYTDEAFEAAFEDYFKPKYRELNVYEVIVPLLKFDGPDTVIELDSDIDVETDDDHQTDIRNVEISPLTRSELSGIYTHETRMISMGTSGLQRASFWSHKIKFEVEVDSGGYGGVENKVIDRVLTALRLFKSGIGAVAKNRQYRRNPNWLDYRENITNFDSSSGPINTPTLTGQQYDLTEDEVDEFTEFWDSYRHQIDPEAGSNIATAIRRFNQTFNKETDEDRLIDCVIGFEATLLKEIRQSESYRFRLPLRAALLLDERSSHDREYIYQFFKKVYDARSRVVHTGGELENQSVREEDLTSRGFVDKTRDFLRQAILEYIDNQSQGKNIDQTNREIDEALKQANYQPS